jgi:hypothetical protein
MAGVQRSHCVRHGDTARGRDRAPKRAKRVMTIRRDFRIFQLEFVGALTFGDPAVRESEAKRAQATVQ